MDSKITNFVDKLTKIRDDLFSGKTVPFNPTMLRKDFDEVISALNIEDFDEKAISEEKGNSPFQRIAEIFWSFGAHMNVAFFNLSQQTYELWLEKVLDYQRHNKVRMHKGLIYHQLGWLKDNYSQNPKEAYNYYVLALIEDIFSKPESEVINCPAYINLSAQFGLPTYKLNQFIKAVKKQEMLPNPRKIVQTIGNEIFLPSYDELTSVDRNIIEDLKEDWETLKTESVSTKGPAFENFTAHFFSSIRNFAIRGVRVNAVSGSKKKEHDYDVFFLNESQLFSEFGKYLLVECKYIEDEVGYADISKFFHKLHNKRCKCGVLFTKCDVVDENLNSTIRSIYDNDDIVILTFNQDDIQNVIDQKENLATLLRNKYEQVRFRLKKLP